MSASRRHALLVALFLSSGASGLIYEVVWLRMLIRAFGVTVYAVSTVLVVYMAGLAAGSMLIGRWVRGRKNLLAAYGTVEVLIGLAALASTAIMEALPAIYRAVAPGLEPAGVALVATRFLLSLAALFLPTFLMGATLPIVSSYLASERGALGKQLGVLYGANTLGAVIGVLVSGFLMLYALGERGTAGVAVLINITAGICALLLARTQPVGSDSHLSTGPGTAPAPASAPVSAELAQKILVLYLLSGFCALSYQVVWSRILNLLLGNSVYAFSLMLGAYLTGISLGSLLMAPVLERIRRPLFVFALLELAAALLALLSLWTTIELALHDSKPGYLYTQIEKFSDFYRLGLDGAIVVFPVTLVLGAMLPVVGRLSHRTGESAETSIGKLYGYNTIGAILGSFLTGFILLSVLGTLKSFLFASLVSFLLALALFRMSGRHEALPRASTWTLCAVLAFALALAFSFRDPLSTVLVERVTAALTTPAGKPELIAHEEDKSGTVTMFRDAKGERHLYINGLYVSSTGNTLPQMMIDMPLAFHPAPKKVLLVGLGVGEAFRASIDRGLDTTVVDLQPSVVELFERFTENQEHYTENPSAHIVINDGRNYLLGTEERFDYVFVDGTPPVFASGMVNLYSREFSELVRGHLTEQGIFGVWFPTICFESDFWMIARGFGEVFPSVSLWADEKVSGIILLGSAAKEPIFETGPEVLESRLRLVAPERRAWFAGLIKRGQVLSGAELQKKAAEYPAVTDDRPYTEFPLAEFWRRKTYYATSHFLFEYVRNRR